MLNHPNAIIVQKTMVRDEGYTFVEMMIAFSIFAILIVILYATFFSNFSGLTNQNATVDLNNEAFSTIRQLKNTINDYGSITVSNNNVYSNGVLIIDGDNNGLLQGSRINIDFNNQTIIEYDNNVMTDNLKNITFVLGPNQSYGFGVTDNMLLIVLELEKQNAEYTLKGGMNIGK